MIDLEALQKSAAREDAGDAVVTRAWLKQVADEISAGRAAQAMVRQNQRIGEVCLDISIDASKAVGFLDRLEPKIERRTTGEYP